MPLTAFHMSAYVLVYKQCSILGMQQVIPFHFISCRLSRYPPGGNHKEYKYKSVILRDPGSEKNPNSAGILRPKEMHHTKLVKLTSATVHDRTDIRPPVPRHGPRPRNVDQEFSSSKGEV